MDERVLKVIALMRGSLHRGWSAAELAGCVNLSPSRLHQLFKDETGTPPARYLRLLRMERARELLESSHLSVKQVMARVGVADESHFVRDFKKTCGLSPAQYRRRFNGGRLHEAPPPSAPPRSPVTAAAPPLLLRRPSHPHQLTLHKSPLLCARKRAELLSLLLMRHAAFAELTTTITDSIVRGLAVPRSIAYRPRRSATSRRLPPSAERPQAASVRRPRSHVSRPRKIAFRKIG